MVQKLSILYSLCISGKFPAVYGDIVPARKLRLHPQLLQGPDYGHCELSKIKLALFQAFDYEGKIQIAQVMVNSTSASDPSHHIDTFFFNIIPINFFRCILMLSYDYGRFVLP
ncbi:hypothetical protein SDC9_175592 [bioreactor metagenome]|uniref:Uncharacterized protein n=1 Tax=bioreactor metagenome TaxID=1076179 RepID=A0A645GWX8_9ZZZZ